VRLQTNLTPEFTEKQRFTPSFPLFLAEGGASGEVYADTETGITVSFCGIIRSEKDTSRIAGNFNLN